MLKAVSELKGKFGEDSVTTDEDELRRHGYSEWSSINIDTLPVAIVYPKSTQEVSAIAQTCTKYKILIGTPSALYQGYAHKKC